MPRGAAVARGAGLSLSSLLPSLLSSLLPSSEGAGGTVEVKPGAVSTPVEVRVMEPEEMVVVNEEVTPGAVITVLEAVLLLESELDSVVVVVVVLSSVDSVAVADPVELGTIAAPFEVTATPQPAHQSRAQVWADEASFSLPQASREQSRTP